MTFKVKLRLLGIIFQGMPKLLNRFLNYLRSNRFYYLIIGVFILEACWIAVSAAYPQAFDENFHFGLIKVYSHYWLPFLTHQPPGADAFGAVTRDPSYLYHYLMSFPYRLIALVIHHQIAQIIILRFINVGFFTIGLILFRKILDKVGVSKALSNLILMLFIFIPIVPQLAGQINYDNLLIPLTATAILLSFRILDEVREHKASILNISLLIGVCLLTSLVTYVFLPIFAGIALFLLVAAYRANRGNIKGFFSQLAQSWRSKRLVIRSLIVLSLVVPFGLFAQRDLVNLIEYHSIVPDCSSVLSVKQCMAYSPWKYNYLQHAKMKSASSPMIYDNPLVYGFQWLYWVWFRLFFAVNGPNSNFTNYPPLPLPAAAALGVFILGIAALIKWWRKVFSDNLRLVLLLVVTTIYLVALLGHGYATYRYTAVLENMNGRYLLPVLILIAAIFGQAISMALSRNQRRKTVIAIIALALFIEGGGVLTFIDRSDPSWDVHNKTIIKVNNVARKVVKKTIVSGKKRYSSHIWFFN